MLPDAGVLYIGLMVLPYLVVYGGLGVSGVLGGSGVLPDPGVLYIGLMVLPYLVVYG